MPKNTDLGRAADVNNQVSTVKKMSTRRLLGRQCLACMYDVDLSWPRMPKGSGALCSSFRTSMPTTTAEKENKNKMEKWRWLGEGKWGE